MKVNPFLLCVSNFYQNEIEMLLDNYVVIL